MNWLQRLKNGDDRAFEEIYDASKKNVYFAIYLIVKNKEVTEDLMQETYLDLLEKKKKLRDDIDIVPFLVTSAKNKAINYYNHNKMEGEFALSLTTYSYASDRVLDTGLLKVVKETLSEEECEVFLLHVIGEYTFKEISKLTKKPIGTLTWMYQECRKKLIDKLGGNDLYE